MNKVLVAEKYGINYYITRAEAENEPVYGISVIMKDDPSDANCAENLYFTEEEAKRRCEWLSENQVFPVSLHEVLRNVI